MSLRPDQQRRYARHVLLPDIGGIGQARLLRACVRIDDAGGAGAVAVQYLAAAGVGRLWIADRGVVAVNDGPLYEAGDLGRTRYDAARDRIAELNPDVDVVTEHHEAAFLLPSSANTASPIQALATGAAAADSIIREILS